MGKDQLLQEQGAHKECQTAEQLEHSLVNVHHVIATQSFTVARYRLLIIMNLTLFLVVIPALIVAVYLNHQLIVELHTVTNVVGGLP